MALFWSKKPKAEKAYEAEAGKPKAGARQRGPSKAAPVAKPKAQAPSAKAALPRGAFADATDAVIAPHITEKSGFLSQSGVYTFKVAAGANKHTIAKAVSILYKVKPVKVAVANLPEKRVFVKGKKGVVPGIRKAVVTLKKGDKIEFV